MSRYWQPHFTAPDDGTEVLAYSASGQRQVVYYKPEMQAWVVSGTECLVLGQVTHWRPLPPTPEEESRELQSRLLKNQGRMPTKEEFAAYVSYLQSLLASSGQRLTVAIKGSASADNEAEESDKSPYWLWVPEQQIWIQIERYHVDRLVDLHHVDFTFFF